MKRLRMAGLLAGIAAGVVLAATPALAQSECGVPATGTVTCTAAGNPYANGITYTVPGDLTVNTTVDARVTRTLSVTSTGGAATVASAGAVATTAAGATGVNVAATGNIAITAAGVTTTGANAAGIIATSSTGTVTITSTAASVATAGGSGILAFGTAGVTITSGTASAIDNSAIYAVSRNGPVAVTITGNTSSQPAADAAVFANSGTTTTVTVAAGATITGNNAMTLASATGTTVTNAGTLVGANGYAIQINRGTATVTNTGTITGRLNFLGNNTSTSNTSSRFVNSGTFNVTGFSLFGTGAPTFVNSGTVQVLASAPTDGTLSFVGLSSFTNSGTVSLANGRAGDQLVIPGTFAGSGASSVVLDARLGTFQPLVDKLTIGGAATGTTNVSIVNVSGGGGGLLPGQVVIQAGAGTSATAFQLAPASAGTAFTSYALAFNATNNSFTLFGTPSTAAYRPLKMTEGARNVSNQVADLWSAHMRAVRDMPTAPGRIWGTLIGGRQDRDDFERTSVFGQATVQNLSYHQDYYGAQIGVDFLGVPGSDAFVLGFTGGYTHSRLGFETQVTSAKYDVLSLGAYTTFHAGPLFVNLLGKYDRYWIKYRDASVGYGVDVHGYGLGGVAEVGYRGQMGDITIEPTVGIAYQNTSLDDFTVLASGFDFRDSDNFRGKAGLRLSKVIERADSHPLTIYIGGNAIKEFGRNDELRYTNNGSTLSFRGRREPLYGEGYAGVSIGGGRATGFVEGTGQFGGGGSLTGGAGRAGLRIAL